jgi:LPXTG-motif cell wall-anchored protein
MSKILRIVKVILGIILMLFGFLLFVAGFSDQEARAAIVIGLVFIGSGVLLFRKKKKPEAKNKTEPKEKPDKVEQPHKEKIYRDAIITTPLTNKGTGMARCKRCGKGGIFHKVNERGLCIDCARIEALEIEAKKLQEDIEHFKSLRAESETAYHKDIDHFRSLHAANETAYNEMKEKKEILYKEIAEMAKKDALSQIASQINEKNKELQGIIDNIGENKNHLDNIIFEQNKSKKAIDSNANKLLKVQTLFKSLQYSVKRYFDEEEMPKAILNESLDEADNLLSTTVKLKLNLMDVRDLRKRYAQNNKVIQELLVKYQGRYTTKTNMTIYKLMVIALEAELQNILYNLKYSKLDKAIKDIKAMTAKYQKIATDGNQSIAPTITKFVGEIEYLFVEAVKIEYEYYIQKERIKEEQRAIREQMRKDAAERKQLEVERKKIEAEEEKYKNEIASIQSQLSEAKDQTLIKQLQERIAKMQSQLTEVEKKKEDIVKLEHGQAGHIYIISNLGSFGENIFKIGMTRRIEPQERIDELGDASVPFRFDVHSTIFSNNAPELESALHKKLHNSRVNKINLRKEFFKTTIDELEDLVYELEPSAQFDRTMLAEQYHQSMAVNEVPESVEIIDDDTMDDDDESEE